MTPWLPITFVALIGLLVLIDLRLVTRHPRIVAPLDGLTSFVLWVLAAVVFGQLVGHVYQTNWLNLEAQLSEPISDKPLNLDGHSAWLQFMTAYVIEVALSLDNIALMAMVIAYFDIPRPTVARALLWHVLLSLAVRLGMIMSAAWLLRTLGWMHWAFGAVLALAMVRTLLLPEVHFDFRSRWPTRYLFRLFAVSPEQRGQHLVTRVEGRWVATPLLMAVLTAAIVDATLAIDSVPAVFSVTKDPFLAYTASTFAVLGLRSLYFALAGVMARFRYLRLSLVFVLLSVAAKSFINRYDPQATLATLVVVTAIVLLGVAASAARNRSWRSVEPLKRTRPTPLEDLSGAVDVSRRNLRKVVILIVGTLVVVLGVIIAPLPGPGPVILVPIGLGILATEFIWARRLLDKLRAQADGLQRRVDGLVSRTSIWTVPAIVAAYWGAIVGVSFAIAGPTPAMFWVVSASVFVPIGVWAVRAAWRFRRGTEDDET